MAIFERDKLPLVANVEQVRSSNIPMMVVVDMIVSAAPLVQTLKGRHQRDWWKRWCHCSTAGKSCEYDSCSLFMFSPAHKAM